MAKTVYYVEMGGEKPNGESFQAEVGPWTTKQDANECAKANRERAKLEGYKNFRAAVVPCELRGGK